MAMRPEFMGATFMTFISSNNASPRGRETKVRARAPGLATVSGLSGRAQRHDADAKAQDEHGKAAAAAGLAPGGEDYWRNSYSREPYYQPGRTFDDYAPAYRVGQERRARARVAVDFDTAEKDLQHDWESQRGSSRLTWEQARLAMRAAWDRVDLDLSA